MVCVMHLKCVCLVLCVCVWSGQSLNVRISLSQLYGSSVMVSVVCQALSHTAMTRALCCRDLLLLQHLYLRLDDNVSTHAAVTAIYPSILSVI